MFVLFYFFKTVSTRLQTQQVICKSKNGERNEGNARNGLGMWEISVGMWGIWMEMWKMVEISMAMQGIKKET